MRNKYSSRAPAITRALAFLSLGAACLAAGCDPASARTRVSDGGPAGSADGAVEWRDADTTGTGTGGDAGPSGATGSDGGATGSDGGPTSSDGGPTSATDAGNPSSQTWPTKRLFEPQYMGWVYAKVGCSHVFPSEGHEPDSAPGTRHPLFLYFIDTLVDPANPASPIGNEGALAVTEAMSRRGFVSLSVGYDTTPMAVGLNAEDQFSCTFDPSLDTSIIARACALPQVDCSLGIAIWGHGRGAFLADSAHDYDPRVTAVWATGYAGNADSTLDRNRIRVVNAENDSAANTETMNLAAGFGAGECANADSCLRADGSGWIRVRARDLTGPGREAGHCWFERMSCLAYGLSLEPNWTDPTSSKLFALESNADWLASTARRR